MTLAIYNPEHDLCLAKGRAHYVPPRSAVGRAIADAQAVMGTLYPEAVCCSVYDPHLSGVLHQCCSIQAWGWDAVVRHELLKRGVPPSLLPTDDELATIRRLQHRSSLLPLQREVWPVRGEAEVKALLQSHSHLVLKAPWSGAGRGIRWVHGALTDIDRAWLLKVVARQGMAMAERRRDVVADLALEYSTLGGGLRFLGYSLFSTGSGVYRANLPLSDEAIVRRVATLTGDLPATRAEVEQWLLAHVVPCYSGPLGIDLMVDRDRHIYVAEMNLRHTMGMVAHVQNNPL